MGRRKKGDSDSLVFESPGDDRPTPVPQKSKSKPNVRPAVEQRRRWREEKQKTLTK